jgi:phosphoglycerate dehydrogenase-like enzyme
MTSPPQGPAIHPTDAPPASFKLTGPPGRIVIFHALAAEYASMIRRRFPGVDVGVAADEVELGELIAHADVVLAARFPLHVLSAAKRLRWIQITNSGVDFLVPAERDLKDVLVTNARGIHAHAMADYVIGAIILLHWGFSSLLRDQQEKRWRTKFVEPLTEKTIGIIGLGAIGAEIAKRAAGMGMRVCGVKRSPSPVEGVEKVLGPDQIRTVMAEGDFIVLVVPATRETLDLIGEAELRSMKESAYLINVARGGIVDEEALIQVLTERKIAGACLDVFTQEPLPTESPLWTLPNVFVTPHIAGNPSRYSEHVFEIFAENLEQLSKGRALRNLVQLSRGY